MVKCSLIKIAANGSATIVLLHSSVVKVVVRILKSLANFATSVPFSLLNEITVTHFLYIYWEITSLVQQL